MAFVVVDLAGFGVQGLTAQDEVRIGGCVSDGDGNSCAVEDHFVDAIANLSR